MKEVRLRRGEVEQAVARERFAVREAVGFIFLR